MDITEFRKTVDSLRNLSISCQKNNNIDDGLGREIRHGRTANMLDCNRHAAESSGNPPVEELKACGPTGVVIHDNNRICHSLNQVYWRPFLAHPIFLLLDWPSLRAATEMLAISAI